jgi:hypothetical protein
MEVPNRDALRLKRTRGSAQTLRVADRWFAAARREDLECELLHAAIVRRSDRNG